MATLLYNRSVKSPRLTMNPPGYRKLSQVIQQGLYCTRTFGSSLLEPNWRRRPRSIPPIRCAPLCQESEEGLTSDR
eukprot:scaffold87241_cov40-Tisochrysis_lutea.AAC.2